MNKSITEKNLINILILVLSVALIIAIVYNLSFLLKIPVMQKGGTITPAPRSEEKAQDSEEEYKRIIEKSKMDYKAFMEQTKSRTKDLP